MIVNPGRFQASIFDKKKNNHAQEIYIKSVKVKSSVKLIYAQIDAELNLHIANICRSAAN